MVENTSLFGLTTDTTVDAGNMCNEMRFLNNSRKQANVQQIKIIVNGETRIGFFALKDILAQTEMFFDYGFDFDEDDKSSKKRDATQEKAAPQKRSKLKTAT